MSSSIRQNGVCIHSAKLHESIVNHVTVPSLFLCSLNQSEWTHGIYYEISGYIIPDIYVIIMICQSEYSGYIMTYLDEMLKITIQLHWTSSYLDSSTATSDCAVRTHWRWRPFCPGQSRTSTLPIQTRMGREDQIVQLFASKICSYLYFHIWGYPKWMVYDGKRLYTSIY